MKNALPEADPVDFIFGSRELLFCSSKANLKKKKDSITLRQLFRIRCSKNLTDGAD